MPAKAGLFKHASSKWCATERSYFVEYRRKTVERKVVRAKKYERNLYQIKSLKIMAFAGC